MNIAACTKIVALLLLCLCMASAQVSSTAPKHWKSGSPVGLGSSGFESNHELRDTVRREILDTNTVRLIAESVHLSDHEKTLFVVAPDRIGAEVWLYTLSDGWSEGCSRFTERLGAYLLARMDGHSRACLLVGITNRPLLASIADPDLRILATNYPILPVSLFHKSESGTTTNRAGQVASRSMTATMVNGKMQLHTNYTHIPQVDEICRWVSYSLVDEEIGWRYVMKFKVDGTLDQIDASKCDAKEFDPKFQTTFREIDSEVTAEMKRGDTFGRLGSVHTFWRLKKEKLKSRGIDWRSPRELNDGVIYD